MPKNNGHEKELDAALEKTVEQVTKAPPVRPLMPSSIEGAFRHTQQTSAIDYYLTPGKDLNEFGLRADIPDQNSEGVVRATCIAIGNSLAVKYHSKLVQDILLTSLTLWPARNGHRIDQATQAITGQGNMNKINGNGWKDKIKGMAFGKKQEAEEG